MKMNFLEKVAMNSPVRRAFQHWFEAPLLERLGGRLSGLSVLEVGCGFGTGTKIIIERFGARRVVAMDLDETMIRHASRRLARYVPQRLELRVGDVTAIDADDATFDAVVNFAVIHHVPAWQAAVAEIRRVLKPNGKFFFEEVTRQWIHRWPYRILFRHPMENRFSAREFIEELERQGIEVGENWVERRGGDFVFGVGRKRSLDGRQPEMRT